MTKVLLLECEREGDVMGGENPKGCRGQRSVGAAVGSDGCRASS